MPIICLMVREKHKMVREMSGKSQGILWGLMAGHPDLVTAYFFWIENIPQDISCDTREVLVQYINSVIKTDIADESDAELYQLVKRLQTHSHSKYF